MSNKIRHVSSVSRSVNSWIDQVKLENIGFEKKVRTKTIDEAKKAELCCTRRPFVTSFKNKFGEKFFCECDVCGRTTKASSSGFTAIKHWNEKMLTLDKETNTIEA